ncbi:MAG: flagellar assembly protein FliH, partial [Hyphomicrobiales bacterium]
MLQHVGIHSRMESMTAPSKYMFSTDFSEPEEQEVVAPPVPEVPKITVAEHKKLLEQAKATAFEEGRAEALKDLQTKQETLLTAEVKQLAGAVGDVLGTLDEIQAHREKDAIGLSFLVARRLC